MEKKESNPHNIVSTFKLAYTNRIGKGEWDDVYLSEEYPDYKIISEVRVHAHTTKLCEVNRSALFEISINTTPLSKIGEVINMDRALYHKPYRHYVMKDDKPVMVDLSKEPVPEGVVSKDEIEHYKKHPTDIAKERFCYCILKKGTGNNRLLMKVVPAVWEALPQYERESWLNKTYSIHPCEGKECPYSWCCVRHEVKTIRKYDKTKYCV